MFVEGLSEWVVRTPAEIMVLLQVRPSARCVPRPRRRQCRCDVLFVGALRASRRHKQTNKQTCGAAKSHGRGAVGPPDQPIPAAVHSPPARLPDRCRTTSGECQRCSTTVGSTSPVLAGLCVPPLTHSLTHSLTAFCFSRRGLSLRDGLGIALSKWESAHDSHSLTVTAAACHGSVVRACARRRRRS